MLVTMGTNTAISAGASQTFTYSPNSVQKVIIRLEDPTGAHSLDAFVTVQIGSKVICNGIVAFGLVGLTKLQCGTDASTSDAHMILDFGNHECLSQDNLYVTVQTGADLDAVDVSAIVNEPGNGIPLRLTSYSDNTFTATNALMGIGFKSGRGAVDEDTSNCEVRTSLYSSAPTFVSCAGRYAASSFGGTYNSDFAIAFRNAVPLNTSVNYSSSVVDRILTIEQDAVTRAELQQGRDSANMARSQAGN